MRYINRKSTPRVIGGAVLRKNNQVITSNYWNTEQDNVIIDTQKPGKGFKHFLKKKDILKFIEIIPNWDLLSNGLDAIVIAQGGEGWDGSYKSLNVG